MHQFCRLGSAIGHRQLGDLPPRPECAPTCASNSWLGLPNIQLTLALGQYARHIILTARPARYPARGRMGEHWLQLLALAPSQPRNNIWLARHSRGIEQQVIPRLRQRVAEYCPALSRDSIP